VKVDRGTSQVLFGLLPGQTADLESRIWRVVEWVDPVPTALDPDSVRQALLGALAPWTQQGTDDGLTAELRTTTVEVVTLNMQRGVLVEPFPQQWRCKRCGRISRARSDRCPCGAASKAQMQFVAYHTCGASRVPMLPRGCPRHSNAIAVRLPGTATARELRFLCPVCNTTLGQGFPYQPCDCGNGPMSLTVHRAAVVYSPRFAVVVNPPEPAVAARLRAGGGGARALEWVLGGMESEDPTEGRQTLAGLIETLRLSNISEETAELLARQAAARGEVDEEGGAPVVALPDEIRENVHNEALSLASAVTGGRTRVSDMVAGTTPPLRTLYEGAYGLAMRDVDLESVDLLANFPVATLAFGYTRGDMNPGAARLVAFRERGRIRAYGALTKTEALLFRLDPLAVHRYLAARGHPLPPVPTRREARIALLQQTQIPWPTQEMYQPLGGDVLTLLHSYAHRTVRRLAAFAGIERDGLAEYLLPHHLCFVVYAASRSDFVLGGLQAVFETSLNRFLEDFLTAESRCALDPGCRSGGGACMACLHLGEPSCRWFNRFLDRSCLFGDRGFLHPDV
jgi:hypothetical protein